MNSTIDANSKFAYHTLSNAEFSAAFVRIVNNDFTYQYKYHLFIRYGDKIYMEVKDVGEVVISYAELQQDRNLKYYYDLSLQLTNDKSMVVQDLLYSSEYNEYQLYNEERFWSTNTALIENDIHNNTLMVISYNDNCYYKINPYDLVNMKYTSREDLHNFRAAYMANYEGEDMWNIYYNLAIEHQTDLIQNKFEEIL
jgi:sulfur relay (sulfurtransferase) DsrF/TusC family protein